VFIEPPGGNTVELREMQIRDDPLTAQLEDVASQLLM